MPKARKPRVAVWKFASCDGCQLTILNCEDALLALADRIEIVYFPEASRAMGKGPYDISIVEGSVSAPLDLERVIKVRQSSSCLITVGACATAGGIQALRNWRNIREFMAYVYAHPDYIETLEKSTPIGEYVRVEYELRGCPISKTQLLELLTALLAGREPQIPRYSVCTECKRRGAVCVMAARGVPCLGPVTHAGCGALCPAYMRGCYGCYGPKETPNTEALSAWWSGLGQTHPEIVRAFRSYNAHADSFRRESEAHER